MLAQCRRGPSHVGHERGVLCVTGAVCHSAELGVHRRGVVVVQGEVVDVNGRTFYYCWLLLYCASNSIKKSVPEFLLYCAVWKKRGGLRKSPKSEEKSPFFTVMSASALQAIAKILRDHANQQEKIIQEAREFDELEVDSDESTQMLCRCADDREENWRIDVPGCTFINQASHEKKLLQAVKRRSTVGHCLLRRFFIVAPPTKRHNYIAGRTYCATDFFIILRLYYIADFSYCASNIITSPRLER
jgi:hypothetical protein